MEGFIVLEEARANEDALGAGESGGRGGWNDAHTHALYKMALILECLTIRTSLRLFIRECHCFNIYNYMV
jgi:hypothetical protein